MGMDVWAIDIPSHKDTEWLSPNGAKGYFRDCYNNYSLANWLTRNIDPEARGDWGLRIFDKEQEGFNTRKWREELYKTVKKWLNKAENLRDKVTYAGYPDSKPIKLSPEKTNDFIDWLKELVSFAELVVTTNSRVDVW